MNKKIQSIAKATVLVLLLILMFFCLKSFGFPTTPMM